MVSHSPLPFSATTTFLDTSRRPKLAWNTVLFTFSTKHYLHTHKRNSSELRTQNGGQKTRESGTRPPLPPQPPAKRNLRSTSAAQATASRVAPTEQNKTSDLRKSLMAAPRALLDNEGILKVEERITAESLYNALNVTTPSP